MFNQPIDVCDDGFGNAYVLDLINFRIRLININTKIGLLFSIPIIFFFKNKLKKINASICSIFQFQPMLETEHKF